MTCLGHKREDISVKFLCIMFLAPPVRSSITSTRFASLISRLGPRTPTFRTMASLPKTMKAVFIEKTGGTDVLHGTIASVGSNVPSDLTTGLRVAYMAQHAYAEYTAAPANSTVPIPDSIDTKTAAASILQALTAVTLIRDAHEVKKGDWVLVTAAAGGVGLWLCQLLKSIGAHVIATASTEEKRNLAKQNGAEVLLEYHEEDRDVFVKKVLEVTGGEGVHAVFDSVGKSTFDSSLAVVRRKGTMVSFGNASGPVEGFSLGRLGAKNIKLVRPTLFNYIATREELQAAAKNLWNFIEKDGLNVKIHDLYPLSDIVRATEDIQSRKTTGKLILKP
ncbi:quinone oxidoreductase [Pyrenophora seminiperda CCB06]|uniref:Probable quinone oxidoreductase n=1 Tax=Pyrenophora seminiperda CCB06 TaxID=1302712 RepID=A0A3M7MDN1_9PLEO|nr:quinone oxidoreductase [Pyrenophora seminiperda CCB06]